MSHYFSKVQESEFKLNQIEDTIRDRAIKLFTASGIFSAKKIDLGSRILAENMIINPNDRVLDLGCGIGVIGIVASRLTKNKVILTDINQRACKLSKMNSKGIKNIKVLCGNTYEKVQDEKFDVILLNPPQTAGKKLCFRMIEDAKKHLNKKGSLQIVARHNKGGKTFSQKMEEVFGNMETIVKQSGYRVYLSKSL
jgi:16S rRNA (guanine1207-N2)-methyltransferase